MNLKGEIRPITALTTKDIQQMYLLMEQHYDNVQEQKFKSDLAAKDGVMYFYNGSRKVCGFSSYRVSEIRFNGQKYTILYSGDTIITKEYWGGLTFLKTFALLLEQCMDKSPYPVYWFLLSKGIRTYLMLPLLFKSFSPQSGKDGSVFDDAFVQHLSHEFFDDSFREKDRIIRFSPPADRLKQQLNIISDKRKVDPHVRFFFKKNPGFADGDELPCIARVSSDNLTKVYTKLVRGKSVV